MVFEQQRRIPACTSTQSVHLFCYISASTRVNLYSVVFEQQRRIPACTSAQSVHLFCYISASTRVNLYSVVFEQQRRIPACTFTQSVNRFCKVGPRREKTCLQWFANNKGAYQPVHSRSLLIAFVKLGLDVRRPVFSGLRTTKAHTSLYIHAVC